jgi:drug/metabolite transporter (DMT)-like permease
MTTSFLLVFVSAVAHAYWNFLLKRSGGTQVFVALSKVSEAVILLPLLLIASRAELPKLLHEWLLPAVGAVLVLANYLSLSAAYRAGDLSFAYPVSRAGILVFLPPLAYVTLHERPGAVGLLAIALVIAGILLLTLPDVSTRALLRFTHSLRTRAAGFSLLAAFFAACYTIWDKRAVQTLTPFTYFASYTVLVAGMYAVLVLRPLPRPQINDEWQRHARPIVQVGLLNAFSYLLILLALRTTTSSYVIAARQLSIAIGAVLGWRLLGEQLPPHKAVGIAVLVAACLLVAFFT